jgi:hypothetical protein
MVLLSITYHQSHDGEVFSVEWTSWLWTMHTPFDFPLFAFRRATNRSTYIVPE